MAIAIFLNEADVKDAPASFHAALCLTPVAQLAAAKTSLAGNAVAPRFSDRDHARCVVAGRRAISEFDAAAAGTGLPESAKIMGRQIAWQLAVLAQRIGRSLPSGAALIRTQEGSWIEARERSAGVRLLLSRILEWGLQHRTSAATPPLPGVYRRLALLQAACLRRRGAFALAPRGRLKLEFDRHLRAAGLRVASLRLTQEGLGEYPRLGRNLLRGTTEVGIAPLPADDDRLRSCSQSFAAIGGSFSDPLLRVAWSAYRDYFDVHLSVLGAVLRDAPGLMNALNAPLAVCYEGNTWLSCAMLDAARSTGRKALVVNHNSHPRTGTPIADAVLAFLFEQRTASPVVTISAHWSADWTRWNAQEARVRRLPYNYVYPPARGTRKRFRILHAGNYQNWSDFIPWVAETSQEYVAGLAALASAMSALPDIELIIRVRSKPEVSPEIVKELVSASANVSVCGTDQDFLEQLAESDLLVSHFSTTVEQALQMGKPVLLWGSTRRFCQFAPSWNPPTTESRSAVYAVRDAQALPGMLRAIRDRHRDRPLSAEEVAQYRNRPEDPAPAALAASVLAL